jgi:NAD(P)-dependent dehydrogenase (short-subunit alcohol dehydrogenase family)
MQKMERIALVTGATSGIGLSTARRLAAEGVRVIVVGRDRQRLEQVESMLDGRGEAIEADLADPQAIAALMARVKNLYGRLDILVVNAGVSGAPDIQDLDPAAYAALMDINCKGATFTFVHALPLLADGATVVFVGSVGGRKGQPADPLYAGSKGFVRAFARSAGTDPALMARRIRVNVVSPGPIDTPLTAEAVQDATADAYVRAMIPMGRWGTADEVADAIQFLTSDASRFITGAEITVDGGMAHA